MNATIYGEYGCGASTNWVYKNTNSYILSVDSSDIWINRVRKSCGDANRIKLHYANVGPVADWGTPKNYNNSSNFIDYTDWLWNQTLLPNLILIDGRFRVCCFLTSLLHAKEGTLIFFDDYTNRPTYHIVERFIKPIKTCGRQALFSVPPKDKLDIDDIIFNINAFRFVFD